MANLFSLSRHFKILVITLLSFGICLERAEKALSMIEELLRICVMCTLSPTAGPQVSHAKPWKRLKYIFLTHTRRENAHKRAVSSSHSK
jgi:hypothetical protein